MICQSDSPEVMDVCVFELDLLHCGKLMVARERNVYENDLVKKNSRTDQL